MPKTFGDLSASEENNILGPDYFGYYKREVEDLLSQDDDDLPFAHSVGDLREVGRVKRTTKNSSQTQENNSTICFGSLFSNGVGARLSEFKKERLKLLLKQSVSNLTQEVDEMINPVLSVCRIRSCLRCKDSLLSSDAITKDDQSKHPHKKHKALSACQDLESENKQLTKSRKGLSDDVVKKCIECLAMSTPQWRAAPDGTNVSLCNSCGLRYTKALKNGPIRNSDTQGGKAGVELDDDLRIILENESSKVEELMKSHCSEISATLHHMEQSLEDLLNALMASCRAMKPAEKQQLCKLIEKLPPRSLDRVAEITELDRSSDLVHIDLDQVDNGTLWRLYFYVATIKAAIAI